MTQPKRRRQDREGRRSPSLPVRAYRELEAWVRRQILERHGDDPEDALPAEVELSLRLPVRLRGRGRREAEARFADSLQKQLARAEEHLHEERHGYRAGHLHCHWCGSSLCEHSSPPDPRSVFIGYEPTGTPRWRDFGSWVVGRMDDRLDRLFQAHPIPLAVYSDGRELTRDLLADFGRRKGPYRILGQLAAGFFPLPRRRGDPRLSFALTAQLVERRGVGGDPAYSLNLISSLPEPHHLQTLLAEGASPLVNRWIQALREGVRRTGDEMREAREKGRRRPLAKSREEARRHLERGGEQLEKLLRRRGRRTSHAEDRTLDPERPTASALSDVRDAGVEDLFLDRLEGTVIVRGPRNRVHVFRPDGVHVTSIVYTGETVRERLRMRRWVPLEADARRALHEEIAARGRIAAGEEEEGAAGTGED